MNPIRLTALSSTVLVVTVQREEGWCAYIGGVPGISHTDEWQEVMHHGDKLPEAVARAVYDVEGDYIL